MSKPIRSWRAAAKVLAVSYCTLWRYRKERGDPPDRVPWWEDEAAVRAWWTGLIAPQPTPPRPARRKPASKARVLDKPLNGTAKVKNLLGP